MKKVIFIILILACATGGYSQDTASNIDVRFGIGSSLLGTGDVSTVTFENELNLNLNRFWTVAGSLNYAKGINLGEGQTTFIQTNATIFFSPLSNASRNDLRLGTGLSWYTVTDTYLPYVAYGNKGNLLDFEYEYQKRNSLGLNFVIENTYAVTERFLIGLKIYSQPYFNNDINSGVMIKAGFRI